MPSIRVCVKRLAEAVESLVPVAAEGDDLGQQRVVVGGHLAAGLHPGVDAHGERADPRTGTAALVTVPALGWKFRAGSSA